MPPSRRCWSTGPTRSCSAARTILLPVLERVVAGRGVTVVDPSPAVARRVVQLLDRYGLHADPAHRAEYTFRTFADEAYRLRLERKALGAL